MFAVLSDIHSNIEALSAVLADIEKRGIEKIYCLGDVVGYGPNPRECLDLIIERSEFCVLGNHDYGAGWHDADSARRVVSMAEQAGVHILRNDLANVNGLTLIGMDDLWADRFEPGAVLPRLPDGEASLVLVHNPDTVDRNGWEEYSGWILAGHTHGGQCKPPFLPPPLLPVQNRRYTGGEFALTGGRRMYLSRGVGHLTRVRFNARPELTLFELKAAELD